MYLSPSARLAIYAEGEFGKGRSKTAEGVLRYGQNPIAAVIDSTSVGKTIVEAVGIKCEAPIVGSIAEAVSLNAEALLLGTAWSGGRLPESWRSDIMSAIRAGMHVVNGLHDFLADDPEIAKLAAQHQKLLLDVRRPPDNLDVATGLALKTKAFIVLTVGTDCSVGKMTTSLELAAETRKRGHKAAFVATGQTGIMITGGSGIAVDRVIGDFMAGATEKIVLEAAPGQDFVYVEGQGSLAHPSFSGVTLALMHGSCPQALILCHKSSRTCIHGKGLEEFPQPAFKRMIEVSQTMTSFLRPAKVVGIGLNTVGLDEAEARRRVEQAQEETGLPATDCVRFGSAPLVDAILAYREKTK
ncbi:MAG TPA: DUF1611 domain-containing protein [Planktothrix sp.]|jgi:uncharacterized NAD-dependent epimerase/dehydratase family protein